MWSVYLKDVCTLCGHTHEVQKRSLSQSKQWTDYLADWLNNELTNLTDWLTDYLSSWLTNWMTNELADLPTNQLSN